MEFGLTDEQRMLGESLTGYLRQNLPMERRRAIAASGKGFDDGLWRGLVEQGIAGLLVPERYGGAGLGLLDAAVCAEALGYAAAPGPFAGPAVMAPLALMASGNAAQQAEWLPRIATGEARIAVAFAGQAGQTGEAKTPMRNGALLGRIEAALDVAGATHLLIYVYGGHAALLPVDATGVGVGPRPSLDPSRPLADLAFTGAMPEMLTAANDPRAAAARVLDAGRVMLAADTLGAGQCMIDQAVAYAKERVQFGRVIGSFQGVKHTLADVVTAFEPCRSLVWYAAYAQDAVPEEARLTALQAKAHVSDAGRDVARLTTEVHGGMGFTDLLGLHFWFKRIAFDRQMLGGPERCREEAAVLQGWAA